MRTITYTYDEQKPTNMEYKEALSLIESYLKSGYAHNTDDFKQALKMAIVALRFRENVVAYAENLIEQDAKHYYGYVKIANILKAQDEVEQRGEMLICPECGLDVHSDFKTCPRCGAKMENDHKCHTCKHYTSGEYDGSCDSYICEHYSGWESDNCN